MNIEDNNFRVVAVGPNSWGAKSTASEAIKFARLNVNWKAIPHDQRSVNISVYICHIDTQVDTANGGLLYPENQKPILIDNVKVNRPTQGRNKK